MPKHIIEPSERWRFNPLSYESITWPKGPEGPTVISRWRKEEDKKEEETEAP